MRKIKWEYFALAGICIVYLAVTGYHLRMVPGEWYGDISIEHRFVLTILAGDWPYRFELSAGPAYHYAVAAFAYLQGASYLTYKIASVATGLVVVLLMYLLGKELAGSRAGLLTALLGASSFWLILFARLGSSPQILSPVLSTGAVYFLARFIRKQQWWNVLVSMVFAGIGLFTYPATFVLPLVVLAVIVWQLIFTKPRLLWLGALVLAITVLVPFVLGFIDSTKNNPAFSQSGYVGSKIAGAGESPLKLALTFGKNMVVALGMFQWTGDNAFRTNASGKPMLDLVSGVLMDIGLVWLFVNRRLRQRWVFVIVPIVILLMPSADPGLPAVEVPSASRSLGAAPFVFLLAGVGLDAVLDGACAVGKESNRWRMLAWIIFSLIMVVIGFANVTKYFGAYAWGLPQHNQPWGLEIAQYIDSLPANVVVKLEGCCWGEWRDPDPESIYYVLQHPQGREDILSGSNVTSCDQIAPGKKYALIFPPDMNSPLVQTFRTCFPQAQGELHEDALGAPAFYTFLVQ